MNLDFSEEQQILRETVRNLCAEYAPLEVVRSMEDDPAGVPPELWKQMGELGLLGVQIPESYGGAGQSALETAILYEEFGRALCPTPHFASSVMSAGLLLLAGSEDQRKRWLPEIASGESAGGRGHRKRKESSQASRFLESDNTERRKKKKKTRKSTQALSGYSFFSFLSFDFFLFEFPHSFHCIRAIVGWRS